MALNNASLRDKIIAELTAQGFVTSGEHAMAQKMAQAIANAVISEIQTNAKANVTGGSSAGLWSIE